MPSKRKAAHRSAKHGKKKRKAYKQQQRVWLTIPRHQHLDWERIAGLEPNTNEKKQYRFSVAKALSDLKHTAKTFHCGLSHLKADRPGEEWLNYLEEHEVRRPAAQKRLKLVRDICNMGLNAEAPVAAAEETHAAAEDNSERPNTGDDLSGGGSDKFSAEDSNDSEGATSAEDSNDAASRVKQAQVPGMRFTLRLPYTVQLHPACTSHALRIHLHALDMHSA